MWRDILGPGPRDWSTTKLFYKTSPATSRLSLESSLRVWQFSCQAFRQPAPEDLPLTEIWDYDLNKHFYYIYFLKLLFIVFFEVNNFNREASKIMLFTISYFSTLWLSWLVVWRSSFLMFLTTSSCRWVPVIKLSQHRHPSPLLSLLRHSERSCWPENLCLRRSWNTPRRKMLLKTRLIPSCIPSLAPDRGERRS